MRSEVFLEKWFKYKINLKNIEKHYTRLEVKKSSNLTQIDRTRIRVSCVQRQIRLVSNIEEFMDLINGFVRNAVEEGSQLVVFPEYNFFDLVGLIRGLKFLNAHLTRKAAKPRISYSQVDDIHDESGGLFLGRIFNGIARPIEQGIRKIMSLLAAGYGVYIYSGSFLLKESGSLYNAGCLFGPDGQEIGLQKKIHLTDFEVKLGIRRDCKIQLYDLPIGKVVFPICMDATYFETFQIARELGAELVILPIANMEEYNKWKSLRGIWPRVQESYLYGLKSSLNGWIGGMHFTGKAGIFAPIGITPERDGILAIASSPEGDQVVSAEINLEKLRMERETAEYHGDRNPVFEAEFVDKTYKV